MTKFSSTRNFGFGKQMAWAGRQALQERYGGGHFGTVAAHADRWRRFVDWAKTFELRDVRQVDESVLAAYGQILARQVTAGELSKSYAQNLLSTVNVVLESMRGDRLVRISPAQVVGRREHVRTKVPKGLDRIPVRQCADELRAKGHDRVASVVELARELGLRVREASMLDARSALRQAEVRGAINITAGTKGGRGNHVDRWVPITRTTMASLHRAAIAQGSARNLIPERNSWRQWNDHVRHTWSAFRSRHGLGKLHDLRAAYACERYEAVTNSAAPVIAGRRIATHVDDHAARQVIALELGHARVDVVAAYIGGLR